MHRSLRSTTRRALLAAGVTTVVGLSASPALAADTPWFQYDFADTLEPAIGPHPVKAFGQTSFVSEDFGGGKVRKVLDVDAGGGIDSPWLWGGAGAEWTVTAYLRLDGTSGTKRLFSPGPHYQSDQGLYVQDGRLVWQPGSGQASGTALAAVLPGMWYQFTATRDASGKLVFYVNGDPKLTVPNTGGSTLLSGNNYTAASFFLDNAQGPNPNQGGAGQIARLRIYGATHSAQQVAAGVTDTIDVTAPEPKLISPEPEAWANGQRVSGTWREWLGSVEGGQAKDVTIELQRNGVVLEAEKPVTPDWASTTIWNASFNSSSLKSGDGYVARVKARDQVGNETVKEYPFIVDATAPTGFELTGPGEVTNTTPMLTGKTSLGPGDRKEIGFRMWTGKEYHGWSNLVSESPGYLDADGTFSIPLKRTFGGNGPLTPGVYTVAVGHCDEVDNCVSAMRTFTVTDGAAVIPQPPVQAVTPVVGTPTVPKSALAPSPAGVLDSAVLTLKSGGRKALLGGRSTMSFTAPVTGKAKLEVRAKKTVVATASGAMEQGSAAKLKLVPTKAGRKLLKARKSRSVVVSLTITQRGQAPQLLEKKLVLKR